MTLPLSAQYGRLVAKGHVDDPAQRAVLDVLETLRGELERPAKKRLFARAEPQHGVYIWGNVGRGKSMMMDLFFDSVAIAHKRRVHFHAFMQEVHARIHRIRKADGADPVAVLARDLAAETKLLCFDELQANDVADATLLYRLFLGLFEAGVVIVSTSNRPPGSLYTGGVQRERFAKFIALIEERMRVLPLSSATDYRYAQVHGMEKRYVWPLAAGESFVEEALGRMVNDPRPKRETITIQGRTFSFRIYDQAIGRCTFDELCGAALGAADYLALAERCDTVILTGIPQLAPERRNEARRFTTLIDTLYERRVKLLCTAEGPPERIYAQGDGAEEFHRTVSRLVEMQSESWGMIDDKISR